MDGASVRGVMGRRWGKLYGGDRAWMRPVLGGDGALNETSVREVMGR